MKKINNILGKGFIGAATVACVLFAAGSTGAPYYGNSVVSHSHAASKAKQISAEEAKQIALAHAKLAKEDVTFIKAKLEYEKNRLVYDVEFYKGNVEYDYDIDAVSKEIISSDFDIKAYNIPAKTIKKQQQNNNTAADIGAEKAKEIALVHAGFSKDKVSSVKARIGYEDGIKVYEVEFKVGNIEYEYDISVSNGQIISSDSEVDD